MHVVKDGSRQLKFEGIKLSESSSREWDSTRWIEFQLYRTVGDQYVLARVGVSLNYHTADCRVVSKNRIQGVPTEVVSTAMIPCKERQPDDMVEDTLYPEGPRYWAMVSDNAEAVVDSLYKRDKNSTLYMTNVAKRLLENAAKEDDALADAYYTEKID